MRMGRVSLTEKQILNRKDHKGTSAKGAKNCHKNMLLFSAE